MKDKNGRQTLARRLTSYWPETLVLLVCAVLLLSDISCKKGYHMDELLSFELANAEFNPWIVPTQPQGRLAKYVENELRGDTLEETLSNLMDTVKDVLQNKGNSRLLTYRADVYEEPVWIDRQSFIDYITVDDRDAFNYLSVYFNVKDDNHPPLHFMLLHTVSSIFRGKLTPIMGCGINLVCVLGMMMLLMRLARQLLEILGHGDWGRAVGLWTAGLYGLSAGASATTLLIRMYAVLSFLCVALLVVHLQKLYCAKLGGKGFDGGNKLLVLVTVLGFWTQYFFLFYCLVLAAVTAVLLWREKRKSELWHYVRSMMAAAVIGVLVFPFSIADVFSSGRGVEALENLSSGLAGYGGRVVSFAEILLERMGTGCVAALVLALVCLGLCRASRGQRQRFKETNVVVLLLVPVIGYFLLAARMSPYLVDRYIMPLFPLSILILVTAVMFGLAQNSCFQGRARIVIWTVLVLVTVVCQLWNPQRYKDSYLYADYEEQENLAREYQEYPCICIGEGVGYYENLPEFAIYEQTLILTPEELEDRQERESIASLEQVVVLLKDGVEREAVCETFERLYGLKLESVLMEAGGAHGDELLLLGQQSNSQIK